MLICMGATTLPNTYMRGSRSFMMIATEVIAEGPSLRTAHLGMKHHIHKSIKSQDLGRVFHPNIQPEEQDTLLQDKMFQLEFNNQRIGLNHYKSKLNNNIYHLSGWSKGETSYLHGSKDVQLHKASSLKNNISDLTRFDIRSESSLEDNSHIHNNFSKFVCNNDVEAKQEPKDSSFGGFTSDLRYKDLGSEHPVNSKISSNWIIDDLRRKNRDSLSYWERGK